MIVYGYRNKEVEKGTGIFACPHCREQRVFKHKKIIRYFTLFFIKLFPLGTVNEFIECQVCKNYYPPSVLTNQLAENSDKAVNTTYQASLQEKSGLRFYWFLIALGTIAFLLGCATSLLLILFQIDNPNNWEGFLGLMVLCPIPATLIGVVILTIGLRMKIKEENPENKI